MGYSAMYDAARTVNFLKILEVALVQNSSYIINESKDTSNHMNRVVLANAVMTNAPYWAQKFQDAIAMQGVTDISTDAAFDTAIGAVWNGYAGITHNGALV